MDPQLKAYLEAIQAGMMGFTDAATFGHGPQVQAGVNAMIGKVAVPSSDLGQNYDDQLKRVQDYYSQYVQQHPAAMAVGSAAGNFAPFAGELYQGFGRASAAIPRTPDMPVAKPMQSVPQEPPLQGMGPGQDLNIPYEKPTPFAPDERGIYNREPYPEEMQSFRDAQHSKQLEEIKSRIANAQPPQADVLPIQSSPVPRSMASKLDEISGPPDPNFPKMGPYKSSPVSPELEKELMRRGNAQRAAHADWTNDIDAANSLTKDQAAQQRAQRNQSVLENIKQNGGKYRDKYGDMGGYETTNMRNTAPPGSLNEHELEVENVLERMSKKDLPYFREELAKDKVSQKLMDKRANIMDDYDSNATRDEEGHIDDDFLDGLDEKLNDVGNDLIARAEKIKQFVENPNYLANKKAIKAGEAETKMAKNAQAFTRRPDADFEKASSIGRKILGENADPEDIEKISNFLLRHPKTLKQLKDVQKSDVPFIWDREKGLFPNFSDDIPLTGKIGKGDPKDYTKDPFAWVDVKYGTSRKLLGRYATENKPVEINTSSDLIAHDDYMENIPEGSVINLYSQEKGDAQAMRNDPMRAGAASDKRILTAGKKLEEAGYKVNYFGFDWSKMKDEGN